MSHTHRMLQMARERTKQQRETQNVRVEKSTIELIDENRHCNTPRSVVINMLLEKAAKTWRIEKGVRTLVELNEDLS